MDASAYKRPSSASNWVRCFGYAQLNAAVGAPFEDDEDTEVREDGTACHWLAERKLHGQTHIASGEISPNGRVITDEMQSAVHDYLWHMRNVGANGWHVEEKAPCSEWFPGVQDGTPDAWHFDGQTLTVFDLKFGFRFVDAYENLQLTIYALTILNLILKLNVHTCKVRIAIFQPRSPNHNGPLRWWSPTPEKLLEMEKLIRDASYQADQPGAKCTPHPGCKHCPAAHACHALRMAAAQATETSYASVPAVMDNARLGYELSIRHAALKVLESQIAGLETQAEHSLRHGERVQGYELAPRRTLWRWKEGAAERLAALEATLGQAITEMKVKSVAQLRALLPKELVEMYAEKPNGGLHLKAVDPKDAERRFNQE